MVLGHRADRDGDVEVTAGVDVTGGVEDRGGRVPGIRARPTSGLPHRPGGAQQAFLLAVPV